MNFFIFNNKKSLDLGVYMLKGTEIPIPNEVIDDIEVEGRRTGSLTYKRGYYKDLEININCRVFKKENYNQVKSYIIKWLTHVKNNNLTFKDKIDKAYRVKYAKIQNFKEDTHNADFTIRFLCEPFLYNANETPLISGYNEEQIYGYNNGDLRCYPKMVYNFEAIPETRTMIISRDPSQEDERMIYRWDYESRMTIYIPPNYIKVEVDCQNLTVYGFFEQTIGGAQSLGKKSLTKTMENSNFFDLPLGEFRIYSSTDGLLQTTIYKNEIFLV